jgi:hypothetical protein
MAFNLKSIKKGAVDRPFRMVLCGVEKIGKSTFAGGAPEPIFLPIKGEEGVDALDVAKFPVASTWGEVTEALQTLGSEEHSFKTLVLDSFSTLEPLIWGACCEENKWKTIEDPGYGKGYAMASEKWRELTNAIDWLRDEKGMNCVLIGHVQIKTFTDPLTGGFDRYRVSLQQSAEDILLRWADIILFARAKVTVKTETGPRDQAKKRALSGRDDDNRVLLTQKRPGHPGGGRGVFGQIPYELPLDWDSFWGAVQDQKTNKE